jgi:FtsH-binding integral membrane protein
MVETVLSAYAALAFVFIGLTLFTFQSKYDFSSLGPYLMGGVFALIGTGLIGLFIPFSRTVDIIYSAMGCVIFSGYIVRRLG